LLIGVKNGCLVKMPGTVRYFALSYVWGQLVTTAETRLCNSVELTKSGAITADAKSLDLPETIRDAIRLVQIVGERLLRVDRFCIIQDDYDNKSKAIQEMGSIDANSYCTIVAADGQDAEYGLRGVGGGSKPRARSQKYLELPTVPPCFNSKTSTLRRGSSGAREVGHIKSSCARKSCSSLLAITSLGEGSALNGEKISLRSRKEPSDHRYWMVV
jgi:hypothetical protein